jgi:hypothetical protein
VQSATKITQSITALLLTAPIIGITLCQAESSTDNLIPAPAQRVGYTNLKFDEDFASIDSVDLNLTRKPGFKWYPIGWFGYPNNTKSNIVVSDGYLTLNGGSLNSAFAIPNRPYYAGEVFGGGAYIEANIRFDPALGAGHGYWPSFWGEAVEHVFDSKDGQAAERWPGQAANYAHFAELDFFEACCGGPYTTSVGYYGTITDWSGPYVPGTGYSHRILNQNHRFDPTGRVINWNQWHTYGTLWVPQDGNEPGYVQWFFDGIPGPQVFYKGPPRNPPLPGQNDGVWAPTVSSLAAETYSILDSQRLALSIATDQGWPIQVRWVRVWQRSMK